MCIVLALLLRTTLALPARGSLAPRAGQVDVPYIFVTFRAENEQSDGERTYLDIYTSKDGIQLEQYAMNVYQPQDGIMRDPSIIFYLGKYYIVHTTDWYSPYIAIISSDDLKSWQWVTSIKTGDWVSQAWAPVRKCIQHYHVVS